MKKSISIFIIILCILFGSKSVFASSFTKLDGAGTYSQGLAYCQSIGFTVATKDDIDWILAHDSGFFTWGMSYWSSTWSGGSNYWWLSWDGHVWADSYTPETATMGVICNGSFDTHILDMTPHSDDTFPSASSSAMTFKLSYYISSSSLSWYSHVIVKLHNIDQNVLGWGNILVPDENDIILAYYDANEAGYFEYSTTTVKLAEGNYTISGTLFKSLGGLAISTIDQRQSNFIIGDSTFLGNISQNAWKQMGVYYASSTATSTETLSTYCNPVSGFEIRNCLAFLFWPSGKDISDTFDLLKTYVLNRVPIGYLTRFTTILVNPATSTLPTFVATVQMDQGYTDTPATEDITINIGDMLAGGGQLLDSIHDPITNKTARDIFYPFVQLLIALAVVFEIVSDLTGMHKSTGENSSKKIP